jgi:hypothetical protein
MWTKERGGWKEREGWPKRRLEWLREYLVLMLPKMLPDVSDDARRRALEYLLEAPDRITVRLPEEEYRGRRYNAFRWTLNCPALDSAVAEFMEREKAAEVTKGSSLPLAYRYRHPNWPIQTEPRDYGCIENWLGCLDNDALDHVPLHEPHWLMVYSAAWKLGIMPKASVQAAQDRASARSERRRANPWPRLCRQCGAEVRTTDGRQAKAKRIRCPSCRQSARKNGQKERS